MWLFCCTQSWWWLSHQGLTWGGIFKMAPSHTQCFRGQPEGCLNQDTQLVLSQNPQLLHFDLFCGSSGLPQHTQEGSRPSKGLYRLEMTVNVTHSVMRPAHVHCRREQLTSISTGSNLWIIFSVSQISKQTHFHRRR